MRRMHGVHAIHTAYLGRVDGARVDEVAVDLLILVADLKLRGGWVLQSVGLDKSTHRSTLSLCNESDLF